MAFPSAGSATIDDCQRSNESPVSNGGVWSATSALTSDGPLYLTSNALVYHSGTYGDSHTTTGYGPDVDAWNVMGTAPSSSQFQGIVSRITGAETSSADGYFSLMNGPAAGQIAMYRLDNGAGTQLGANISQTFTAGDSYGQQLIGTGTGNFHVWYKVGAGAWTDMGNRTDATYNSSGKIAPIVTIGGGSVTKVSGGTYSTGTGSMFQHHNLEGLGSVGSKQFYQGSAGGINGRAREVIHYYSRKAA